MKSFSRRNFLKTGAIGVAGLTAWPLLKSCATPVSDTIRLGIIGLGRQTNFLVHGFSNIPGVKIVAGCDVYEIKRQRFYWQVKYYQEQLEQNVEVDTYENYQDMIGRRDIDAVVIVTPDHWHALQAIDACKAGKDIYLEKPLTFTIEEGKRVVKAVRDNNLICAVGSQQRSDLSFQHAIKMVQEGRIGRVGKMSAWVGDPPSPYNLPEEQLPAGLDWDKWLGPNPYVHYNHKLNPPISLNPTQNETFWAQWRYFRETGGGSLCDWGAHNFDIGQWTLKKDNGGPVKVIPAGVDGHTHITYVYADGTIMVNEPFDAAQTFGVKYWGEDAWIEVQRGEFRASDPSLMPDDKNKDADVPYETATPHLVDFIDSLRSRKDPIAPVEAGHRSGTLGILGNIATDLGRALDWDPARENFVNDTEAARFLHRQYRDGYSL